MEILQPFPLLELLLFSLPTSCKFQMNGCEKIQDSNNIIYHEEECEFRNVSCIYRNCATHIIYKGLENHFKVRLDFIGLLFQI